MAIGFTGSIADDEKKEMEEFQKLEQELRNEFQKTHGFEERLVLELREIQDLEHNIELILAQLGPIRNLMEKRHRLVYRLIEEGSKMLTDVDINLCEELMKYVNSIDKSLRPLVNQVFEEVEKLLLVESHELYKHSEENQKAMKSVDKQARQIKLELDGFIRHAKSFNDDIDKIHAIVTRLKAEREKRPTNAVNKIGF